MKSCHNLTKSKILGNAASPMQSEWCLQVSVCHSLCIAIGDATFPKIYFVRLCREFIINLWANWNLGCLTICFQDSGSSARLHTCSLCALFQCILHCPELCYDFECPKILKFWGGVFTRQYWRFAFVFWIVALEYWCLGVSLWNRVFDELIRPVSVWRQLAIEALPKRSVWLYVTPSYYVTHMYQHGPWLRTGPQLRTGGEQRVNCFCTRKTLHRDSKWIIDILGPQIAAEKCIFKVHYWDWKSTCPKSAKVSLHSLWATQLH